jgi:hypothetical protein
MPATKKPVLLTATKKPVLLTATKMKQDSNQLLQCQNTNCPNEVLAAKQQEKEIELKIDGLKKQVNSKEITMEQFLIEITKLKSSIKKTKTSSDFITCAFKKCDKHVIQMMTNLLSIKENQCATNKNKTVCSLVKELKTILAKKKNLTVDDYKKFMDMVI